MYVRIPQGKLLAYFTAEKNHITFDKERAWVFSNYENAMKHATINNGYVSIK